MVNKKKTKQKLITKGAPFEVPALVLVQEQRRILF